MPGLSEKDLQQYIVDYLCSQPIVDASGNVTPEMEYQEIAIRTGRITVRGA